MAVYMTTLESPFKMLLYGYVVGQNKIQVEVWLLLQTGYVVKIQYNTIQILLSTPHGGFSETSINSTGNQKKKKKSITNWLSINY